MKRKIILTIIGYLLFAIGKTLMIGSYLSLSHVDAMFTLVSKLGIPYIDNYSEGVIFLQSIFAIIIISIILLSDIKLKIRYVLLGSLATFASSTAIYIFHDIIFESLFGDVTINFIIRIFMTITGYLIFTLGTYMFAVQRLLVQPYTLLPLALSDLTKTSFGSMKLIEDITVFIVAVIGAYTIGGIGLNVFSVVMALSMGPLFNQYRKISLINSSESK